MCVANGTIPAGSTTRVMCYDKGDSRLFGFCGYCYTNLTFEQHKVLAERELVSMEKPQVQLVTRYQPGVSPYLTALLTALSLLAGFGAAALFWWRHA